MLGQAESGHINFTSWRIRPCGISNHGELGFDKFVGVQKLSMSVKTTYTSRAV